MSKMDEAQRAESERRRVERRNTPRRRRLGASIRKNGEIAAKEIEVVTTDAEADARMLAAILAPSYARQVAYYKKYADSVPDPHRTAADEQARLIEEARESPAINVTWQQMGALGEVDLQSALSAWLGVLDYANEELESGGRGALVSDQTPIERARYLAVRDSFIDQWKPEGGIDRAMIEMLAQSYNLYLYWSLISHARSTGLCTDLEEKWAQRHDKRRNWKAPYEMMRQDIEEAHMMAERYNRIFLRTLRQMRDLRRYAPPVIVNNGGQVNVANQQFNAKG
jgi:hypothetical protein